MIAALVMTGLAVCAGALEQAPADATRHAVGVTVDLLPPVMSAMAGELGLSGQLW